MPASNIVGVFFVHSQKFVTKKPIDYEQLALYHSLDTHRKILYYICTLSALNFKLNCMGMRKKSRNAMKAQWKIDKVKRDKNKLKRVKKAAAQAA